MPANDKKLQGLVIKTPVECTSVELEAFCKLVASGGEVADAGLLERLRAAKSLAFCYEQGELAGVAALKNPDAGYRQRVFEGAKAKLDPETFPCELGWVVVSEGHRGKGLSAELVEPLIRESTGNVYATSNSGNERMHQGLRRFGFVETGQSYPSKEHPGTTLALFIWQPGTDGSPKCQ